MNQFKNPFKDGIAPKNLYKEKGLDDYLIDAERERLGMRIAIQKAFEEAYYAREKD